MGLCPDGSWASLPSPTLAHKRAPPTFPSGAAGEGGGAVQGGGGRNMRGECRCQVSLSGRALPQRTAPPAPKLFWEGEKTPGGGDCEPSPLQNYRLRSTPSRIQALPARRDAGAPRPPHRPSPSSPAPMGGARPDPAPGRALTPEAPVPLSSFPAPRWAPPARGTFRGGRRRLAGPPHWPSAPLPGRPAPIGSQRRHSGTDPASQRRLGLPPSSGLTASSR